MVRESSDDAFEAQEPAMPRVSIMDFFVCVPINSPFLFKQN